MKIIPQEIKFNHNYFHSIDSEAKAYWLGFLFADGCVFEEKTSSKSMTLKLAIKDLDHLEKFKQSLYCCLNIHKINDDAYIKLYSNTLCDDLIRHGRTPRKSLTLTYPTIEPNLNKHFIRGYFDGDGCVCWHNSGNGIGGPRISVIGTSMFLTDMQQIINFHLQIPPKNKLGRTGKAFVYSNNAYKQVRTIMDWLYQESTIFLSRKHDRYNEIKWGKQIL